MASRTLHLAPQAASTCDIRDVASVSSLSTRGEKRSIPPRRGCPLVFIHVLHKLDRRRRTTMGGFGFQTTDSRTDWSRGGGTAAHSRPTTRCVFGPPRPILQMKMSRSCGSSIVNSIRRSAARACGCACSRSHSDGRNRAGQPGRGHRDRDCGVRRGAPTVPGTVHRPRIVDTGFGHAGVAYVALAAPGEEVAEIRLSVQADGRIVVAARSSTSRRRPTSTAHRRGTPAGRRHARSALRRRRSREPVDAVGNQRPVRRGPPTEKSSSAAIRSSPIPTANPAYAPVIFQLKGGDLATPKPLRERRAVEYSTPATATTS